MTENQFLDNLARFQVDGWMRLVIVWTDETGQRADSFDDDLSFCVRDGALLPGAFELALRQLDALQTVNDHRSPRGDYCIEALRASLAAAHNSENAHAEQWALVYLAAEAEYTAVEPETHAAMKPLLVSAKRAQATISRRAAWQAACTLIPRLEGPGVDRLCAALERIGHGDLAEALRPAKLATLPDDLPLPNIVQLVRRLKALGATPEVLEGVARDVAQPLVRARRVDDLSKLADALTETLGGDRQAQASGDILMGRCCLQLREPRSFLARVGTDARPWEHDLLPAVKISLWTERSNALRLIGRQQDALRVIDQVLGLFPENADDANRRVARRNRAILLRETGAPDLSITELEHLLEQATETERIRVLDSLALGYLTLGRPADAARCLQQALDLAVGPSARDAPRLRASLTLAQTAAGQEVDLLQEIQQLDEFLDKDPATLLPIASALVNALNLSGELPSASIATAIGRVRAALEVIIQHAGAAHDVGTVMSSARILAHLSHRLGLPEEEAFWNDAITTAREHNLVPDPDVLLAKARLAYARGDFISARKFLMDLPASAAMVSGRAVDLLAVAQGMSGSFNAAFDDLVQTVVDRGAAPEDLRLVAEIGRGILAFSRNSTGFMPVNGAGPGLLEAGLGASVLSRLSPPTDQLAVLEWIVTRRLVVGLLTIVRSSGTVTSHWWTGWEGDLAELRDQIRERLNNWTTRPGDPFDLPQWRTFEASLVSFLQQFLLREDHLIFIEHPYHLGLPFHAAVRDNWTSSYASGWTELLARQSSPLRDPIRSLGVACVPRFHESQAVVTAMQNSANRTRGLAATLGLELQVVEGTTCDKTAIRELLRRTDAVKFLCHGFVGGPDKDVALMVASYEALPVALSVAAQSRVGGWYRFGWRDCLDVESAPAVIFSAACSSGVTHMVGNIQFGIYAGLAGKGTLSLVAPWWDVVAETILPIIDSAFEHYLRDQIGLAKALGKACKAASTNLPAWQAWALSIEGEWR